MITLAKLYKRDKGICHICGQRVNNLRDATRDHVVPRDLGGTAGFRSNNIRLAHKWCNSAKSNNFFIAEQHQSGWIIVGPKSEIVSDMFDSEFEAKGVADQMNRDRVYMMQHYEESQAVALDSDFDIIIIKKKDV